MVATVTTRRSDSREGYSRLPVCVGITDGVTGTRMVEVGAGVRATGERRTGSVIGCTGQGQG